MAVREGERRRRDDAEDQTTPSHEAERGRQAEQPSQIPPRGWKDVLVRTAKQVKADDVSTHAAAVAFYAMLALFPALIALVSIYGLLANPRDVRSQLESFVAAMPADAGELITKQLSAIARTSPSGLRMGLIIGVVAAIWTASNGVKAMTKALNVAYDETETRKFLTLRVLSIVLTVLGVVGVVVMVALIAALPSVLNRVSDNDALQVVGSVLRWPILALLILFALAVLYRYGPNRRKPEWRWVSWGSAAAALIWLAASIGFSIYISLLGSYNKTYGSLGAVIILLLWLYLSAFAVLLGAELNAELERQTRYDTTSGEDRPMGARDAHAADTLGESTGS
jgi:membrane protein